MQPGKSARLFRAGQDVSEWLWRGRGLRAGEGTLYKGVRWRRNDGLQWPGRALPSWLRHDERPGAGAEPVAEGVRRRRGEGLRKHWQYVFLRERRCKRPRPGRLLLQEG